MITSSTINVDRDQGAYRKITCNHVDHLAVVHIEHWKALPVEDVEITKIDHATAFDNMLAENEINQWITDINNGLDPAHVEISENNFINSVPEFNTWEVAVNGAVLPFLQTQQPAHTQELIKIADLWGRLSNQEQSAIAGQPNDVSAEVQIAINAQAVNEAYIPLIDEQGSPRP